MEASPLTQQNRPGPFQSKIDYLYEELLKGDSDIALTNGFWKEFFLLRPNTTKLRQRLEDFSADDLLQIQDETQQLFARAVAEAKSGNGVSDEFALDTLTVFLGSVLVKRYTNPSSEIITVLAGLDEVDYVFSDFANTLESIVRTGSSLELRQKAIMAALALTSGAYQTSLISYFTHRDLFPALMKYVQDVDTPIRAFEPLLLLSLLANYNKFEFRNPYRLRLEDFVNESTVQKIVQGLGANCAKCRDSYVLIQDDVEEGWTLSNTLRYIGLGVLAPSRPSTPVQNAEEAKEKFSALPTTTAAVLLLTYDFTIANKLFSYSLITQPSPPNSKEPPFSAFLSLTSYILHHAYRSVRASLYGLLNLLTLRLLTEDSSLCSKLFLPASALPVRLCRQRQPFLPSTPSSRPPAATILDICLDTINHNLRRRLDIPLYTAALNVVHRLLSHCSSTRTRFPYHWPLLWQTLLSLLRFLTTYATPLLSESNQLTALLPPFLATLALAVKEGVTFLPDAGAGDHDDLLYKLVEHAHYLPRFRGAFEALFTAREKRAMGLLVHVSGYYSQLLEEEKKGAGGKQQQQQLSPAQVVKVIRKGYEGLTISEDELGEEGGWGVWQPWREGDERGLLKRVARVAVEDARKVGRE